MAEKGGIARVATAAAAAAGTGAAQLGLGYGLGVIVWPVTATPDDSVWLGSLGWATWITASATVFGAVLAARLGGDSAPRPHPTWRLALAISAALGAMMAVALIALPARSAVRADTLTPQVTAGGYALLGVVLGLVVAYWAVASRPVAANLLVTGIWLWALAITAIVVDLTVHRPSATYLTSWQFAELADGGRFGTIFWPSALLTLVAAFLIGIVAAAPAIRRGHLDLAAAASGTVGPLVVAIAFLALSPRLTGTLSPLESAYLMAPYAVLAGLAGSALAVAAGRAAAARRTPHALPPDTEAAPHSRATSATASATTTRPGPAGTAAAQTSQAGAAADPTRRVGAAAIPAQVDRGPRPGLAGRLSKLGRTSKSTGPTEADAADDATAQAAPRRQTEAIAAGDSDRQAEADSLARAEAAGVASPEGQALSAGESDQAGHANKTGLAGVTSRFTLFGKRAKTSQGEENGQAERSPTDQLAPHQTGANPAESDLTGQNRRNVLPRDADQSASINRPGQTDPGQSGGISRPEPTDADQSASSSRPEETGPGEETGRTSQSGQVGETGRAARSGSGALPASGSSATTRSVSSRAKATPPASRAKPLTPPASSTRSDIGDSDDLASPTSSTGAGAGAGAAHGTSRAAKSDQADPETTAARPARERAKKAAPPRKATPPAPSRSTVTPPPADPTVAQINPRPPEDT